ncbi:MAG: DNA-3-methyladenine glycosylase, partial [Bacteroidota bacterium]
PQLTAGPGVMSKALGIHKSMTGSSLVNPESSMYIEDRGIRISPKEIIASPRVGIDYAEECAAWPWRFRIRNNRWTSKAK